MVQVFVFGHAKKNPTIICLSLIAVFLSVFPVKANAKIYTECSSRVAKAVKAKSDIEAMATALNLLKEDIGRFPDQKEGLDLLVRGPNEIKNWNGPYIRSFKVPHDPWGQEYSYRHPSKKSSGSFYLISFGPNGVEDTEHIDDITNIAPLDWGKIETLTSEQRMILIIGSVCFFLLLCFCLAIINRPSLETFGARLSKSSLVIILGFLFTPLVGIFFGDCAEDFYIFSVIPRLWACLSLSGLVIVVVSALKNGWSEKVSEALLYSGIPLFLFYGLGGLICF